MELAVDMTKPVQVEIGAPGLRGLAQEIRTALATRKGSVYLDRDFGLSWDMIDLSIPAAKQMLIAEIAMTLHECVPRVKFKSVTFDLDKENAMEGIMPTIVTVEIKEEYIDDFR